MSRSSPAVRRVRERPGAPALSDLLDLSDFSFLLTGHDWRVLALDATDVVGIDSGGYVAAGIEFAGRVVCLLHFLSLSAGAFP